MQSIASYTDICISVIHFLYNITFRSRTAPQTTDAKHTFATQLFIPFTRDLYIIRFYIIYNSSPSIL